MKRKCFNNVVITPITLRKILAD